MGDPPLSFNFSESIILDELSQVQKDTNELSKSCLIGKMLGVLLDIRTIVAKTKADWKFLTGEVDYLEMGNQWVLFRFANLSDMFLVWSECPCHV